MKKKMRSVCVIEVIAVLAVFACGQDLAHPAGLVVQRNNVGPPDGLADTELLLAFVVFRHGDRTPDQEELELYSKDEKYKNVFFPYGMKALTNKGKQRGYLVGKYLRRRYDGFISRLYLPDEVVIRTTDYDRTKMTALTALAALYPPLPAQKWNPSLDWQPVPYNTPAPQLDDFLYWYHCPLYLMSREQVYNNSPEIQKWVQPYQELFDLLTQKTGNNITNSLDVFYLDNLFQTLENVGIKPPKWAEDVMPQIQDMTKIEYAVQFYNTDLIKIATGVLMTEVMNATNAYINGVTDQPKLRLYSSHENNVAAWLAAARVFVPHQPNYGSTFSLEFRRNKLTGQYGIAAVYAKDAGGPGRVIPVQGCGGQLLCDYEKFFNLTRDVMWSYDDYVRECPITL